jgi:UDP-3-O-[3-hydroxymyristoyl] glucosamine N-acyltransferase
VGANCFIAGQVGVADHTTIGDRVKIGAQSGIDKDVPDGEIRFGSPALAGINYHRSFAVFKELPDLRRRVMKLEAELANKE